MEHDAGVTICFGAALLCLLHSNHSGEFGIESQVQTPLEIVRGAIIGAASMLVCWDKRRFWVNLRLASLPIFSL